MSRIATLIICILFALVCCSAAYYLCLVAALPFCLFGMTAAAIGFFSFRIFRSIEPAADYKKSSLSFALIVLASVAAMIYLSLPDHLKYGTWDAYAMWNYHARFLSDPVNWHRLYKISTFDHIDYPMGLSSMIAPFWRLTGGAPSIVPLLFTWWWMVSIPVLLAATLAPRNKVIALIAMLYLCTSVHFRMKGISEQADTPLGLLFLGAFITVSNYRESSNKAWAILCGACVAGAAWMKNEGMILGGIFLLFHLKTIFSKETIPAFITGALLPLCALLIHKAAFAPPNDLLVLSGQKSHFQMLIDRERMQTIARSFADIMWQSLRPIIFFTAAYSVWCILKRRLPSAIVVAVITCLFCYFGVYMVTPYDLGWHLFTSFDRLLHQLVPVMLWGIGLHISGERKDSASAASL